MFETPAQQQVEVLEASVADQVAEAKKEITEDVSWTLKDSELRSETVVCSRGVIDTGRNRDPEKTTPDVPYRPVCGNRISLRR